MENQFEALAPIIGATMVLYVVVMFLVGWFAQRRVHDVEDYVVAGRRLGPFLGTATLLATWFGAAALLTSADQVRASGVTGATLDPVGAGICLILVSIFFAKPLWEAKILTLSDFFANTFGRKEEVIASVLMIPPYFGWIAAQFMALAGMLHLFFGIPITLGIALVALVGFGYTLLGGMWAVTLTDAIQMGIVIFGLLAVAITVMGEIGNGDATLGYMRLLNETPPERLTFIQTDTLPQFVTWFGILCAGALGNIPSQDVMQRVFSSRSVNTARFACATAGILYLSLGMVPILMGLAGHMLFEEGTATLPQLAAMFLHPVMAVIFVVTLLSTVLSTIDSAMLAPATVLSHNILAHTKRFQGTNPLKLTRYSLGIVALCSLSLAYVGESAYAMLESGYELGMVSLLAPLVYGVYHKAPNARGALGSMLSGTSLWFLHMFAGWESFFNISDMLPVGLSCTAISFLAYWIFRTRKTTITD